MFKLNQIDLFNTPLNRPIKEIWQQSAFHPIDDSYESDFKLEENIEPANSLKQTGSAFQLINQRVNTVQNAISKLNIARSKRGMTVGLPF